VAFVRMRRSSAKSRRGALTLLVAFGAAAILLQSGAAAVGDVGYKDQSFSGAGVAPSGSKPESKLWWNDGFWWASMWSATANSFHIFRLNVATQTWSDTGVPLDNRSGTRADTLWDGSHLYVASHVFSTCGCSTSAFGFPSRLYRFSYDASTKTYSLDSGFPVSINNTKTETLVIDKDSTGMVWATWAQDGQIEVSHTLGDDRTWGTPFVLPASGATGLSTDDISSLIAFGGNSIGVMWSNQPASAMYFAVHQDGAPDTSWSPSRTAIQGPNYADDHINLKSLQADSSGRVFAAVKTSLNDLPNPNPNAPLTMLLSRDPATGDWSSAVFGRIADDHTRPIVLLDETNHVIHMFATAGESGGTIYEKTSPLDAISFPTGLGTPFIRDAASSNMNNATSTKQNVNATTGLVVLATNDSTGFYWHNYESLAQQAPPVAGFTASPTSGTAPLSVAFTDTSSGSPTAWSWSFGDGATSTAQNPSHTYTTPGTYSVSLTVSNSSGTDTATQSNYIVVTSPPPPVASFTASPTSGTAPLSVAFTDASSGSPTGWSWSFGDGGTSTAQNPSHTYTTPGTYSVSLTVSNSSGTDTATQSNYITVTPPPPDFTLSASPANVAVVRGNTAKYTISITPTNGFTGPVSLSVSGLPANSTATFTQNPVDVPSSLSSTLSVATTSTTKTGGATLTISGISGSLTHSVTVSLQVRKK
jgi:PKD repeat protein